MIPFSSAQFKDDDGSDVIVYADPALIAFVFFAPKQQATAIVASGGGNVMVKESVQKVLELKQNALAGTTKQKGEQTNGTK